MGAAHGRSRGDDLGSHRAAIDVPHREPFNSRLIEARHGPKRPRDQVQLVLDHKVWRLKWCGERSALSWLRRTVEAGRVVPSSPAEEHAGLTDPRERRKLIHRRDQEGRQPPVDRLVYGDDGQRAVARKVALEVRADDT